MAEYEHVVDPSEWDEPFGHAEIVRGLWRAARAQRLPHALLFSGPPGVGKLRAARWLTLGLLCARGIPVEGGAPCGVCGPCKRLRANSHPDCLLVDVRQEHPDRRSEDLRIGRFVRRTEPNAWDGPVPEEFQSLRASEGGRRVIHVREIERANEHAQNSMLKMLEEPADEVLWILECSHPTQLLPTVHSRCVSVRFEKLATEDVVRALRAHDVDPQLAPQLARWSAGSMGEALRMHAEHVWEMRALLDLVLRGSVAPTTAAQAFWELDGTFEGKTPKAQERARLRPMLDLAAAVLADFERYACGASASELLHGDLVAGEPLPGSVCSSGARVRALETVLTLRADVEANIDPALLLERALLELAPGAVRRPTAPPARSRP